MSKGKTIAVLAATMIASTTWAGWFAYSIDTGVNSLGGSSESTLNFLQAVPGVNVVVSDDVWALSEGSSQSVIGCFQNEKKFCAKVVATVDGVVVVISGPIEATLKFAGRNAKALAEKLAGATTFVVKATGDIVFTTIAAGGNVIQYTVKGKIDDAVDAVLSYPQDVFEAGTQSGMHYESLITDW